MEWSLLDKVLAFFGFHKTIRHWIKCIYCNNVSCITNNGHISSFFDLKRGLRQGCPLSPYLFIMVVEVLSNTIRNNNDIRGVSIGTYESKVHQYADDTFCTIRNEEKSFNELFACISNFSKISGLTLNSDKTEILVTKNYEEKHFIPKDWIKPRINLLGVKIDNDLELMRKINYEPKIKKIEDCFNIWKQRDLSLIGRIHIIKTMAGSQLVYNFSSIISPDEQYMRKVESLFYKFLWNSETERIRRNTIIAPYDQGGLQMLDIRSQNIALKLKWIKLYKDQINDKCPDFWCIWLKSCLPEIEIEYFLECNLDPKDLTKCTKIEPNTFFCEVLSYWFAEKFQKKPAKKGDILNQNLWYNSLIKRKGQVSFVKKWYEFGIKKVKDLVIEDRWVTVKELETKLGKNYNFLELIGITQDCPAEWKHIFKGPSQSTSSNLNPISFVCKEMYKKL